jgi:transcriptional regulator with XRE-family HTH domain
VRSGAAPEQARARGAVARRARQAPFEKGLAGLLNDFMATHGLTLQQMSERSDLAIATIAALRTGTRGKRPQPATLAKLAEAMGLGVDQLDEAVAVGGGPARLRETQLVAQFRQLDDEGKAEIEGLLSRLVLRRRRR